MAKRIWQRTGPWLTLGVPFFALAAWSWRKWPDLTVDFGRQLYIPWRLSEGDLLYRDIAHIMGPASQLLNAWLFGLFGVSLTTLIAANLAVLAIVLFATYRVLRCFVSAWNAQMLCLLFLCLFAFGQYVGNGSYNYVCPYRHEVTHGLAATLLMVVSLLAWTARPRVPTMLVAGCCLGLTAVMKTEMFLAAAGTAAVTLGGSLPVVRERGRRFLIDAGAFAAAALVPALVCWAVLARGLHADTALSAVFTNWVLTLQPDLYASNPFYRTAAGLDRPIANAGRMVTAGLGWLAVVVAFGALDRACAGLRRARRAVAVLVGTAVFAVGWLAVPVHTWFTAARPLPIVAFGTLLVVCASWARKRSRPEAWRELLPLGVWSALSSLLLLKMVLAARISFYGFVHAMPAALLLGGLLLETVPGWLARRRGGGDLFRAASVGLLAAWAAAGLQTSQSFYREKVLVVGRGGDRFYHDPGFSARNALMPRVLDDLERELPPGATLTVLPEGGMLNYLLRRRNPTPYYLLTPWEMEAFGGEPAVLRRMQAEPPDYFLLLSIDMREYGRRFFGDPGFGDTIRSWITSRYGEVRRFAAGGQPGFEAVLLRRRSAVVGGE